jgi:hypothetical protein
MSRFPSLAATSSVAAAVFFITTHTTALADATDSSTLQSIVVTAQLRRFPRSVLSCS